MSMHLQCLHKQTDSFVLQKRETGVQRTAQHSQKHLSFQTAAESASSLPAWAAAPGLDVLGAAAFPSVLSFGLGPMRRDGDCLRCMKDVFPSDILRHVEAFS